MERKFYRIAKGLEDGFWYTRSGVKLDNPIFDMPMDYDENHLGHVSMVGSIKELISYFKLRNILKLVLFKGYKIYKLKTDKYKFYNGYYLIEERIYYNEMEVKQNKSRFFLKWGYNKVR